MGVTETTSAKLNSDSTGLEACFIVSRWEGRKMREMRRLRKLRKMGGREMRKMRIYEQACQAGNRDREREIPSIYSVSPQWAQPEERIRGRPHSR